MGAGLLKIAGLFHADAREVLEMPYLRETPVLLDDSKLPAQLGGLHKAFLWRGHPADARVDAGAAR